MRPNFRVAVRRSPENIDSTSATPFGKLPQRRREDNICPSSRARTKLPKQSPEANACHAYDISDHRRLHQADLKSLHPTSDANGLPLMIPDYFFGRTGIRRFIGPKRVAVLVMFIAGIALAYYLR